MPDPNLALVSDAEKRLGTMYDAMRSAARDGGASVTGKQAFLLAALEDGWTVSDLTQRGAYFGTNVSYNLKILTKAKLIERTPGKSDRRTVLVKLTNRGRTIANAVQKGLAALAIKRA